MASEHETILTMEATPVKYGAGASEDAGWELKRLGTKRVMLVTDPGVAALGHPERIKGLIEAEGIEVVVYDRVRVEPTIDSFQQAADFALEHEVDGFVSVGGGSSIDTAKVANLVSTYPAPVMDYVNPPVGEGKKPPGVLKPHLAIPTTSGTGSEATTVAVLDIPDIKVTRIATCARPRRSSTPSSPARCRPRSRPPPGSTSSATPPNRSCPSRSTHASGPARPTNGRPTRAQTRSPTSGRPKRSSSGASTSVGRSPMLTTSRRAGS